MRYLWIIAVLAILFIGCIDVPIETMEEKIDQVEYRETIEQSDVRQCLDDSLPDNPINENRLVNIHFDRTVYRQYTLAEMKEVLNSQEWLRELTYYKYDRNCTDFAIMFLAVCRGLMPSAALGTIEYLPAYKPPLVGYQLTGHKVVIFVYRDYHGNLICVLVDPRTKKISDLKEIDIRVEEIDM